MSLVRIGDEDSFILDINEPKETYHFDFNSSWISNNSPTKRVYIRKIKTFANPLVFVVVFRIANEAYNFTHKNKRSIFIRIAYTLNDNSIRNVLEHIKDDINLHLKGLYPNNDFSLEYVYSDGAVNFSSNIPRQKYQSAIQFRQDSLKLLGIKPESAYYLDHFESILIPIHLNIKHPAINTFRDVWGVDNLYLHSSFSDKPFGYVCRANEKYNKLSKCFPIRDVGFDIWFTIDGKKLFTPEIDMLLLELSFKE
jgi:hypothetical protein